MKIVFSAFNKKLLSKPMEFPDNTMPEFYMPMPLDVLARGGRMDGSMVFEKPLIKRAKFQRTGNSYYLPDLGYERDEKNLEQNWAKEYVLVDIS